MAQDKGSNNLFKRLTTLFRSGPVVKRKVRSIDTRVAMPDSKSSAVGIFQKSTSPTYSFITANAYTLQERLARYADFNEMEYSLMSSTQIASTDGNFVEIGELANLCEANPDYTFPVYSYNHESQTLVVAIGKQARKTRTDHAWTVTFDNGQSITGSANHRLMLRDGSYKMIEDLRQGDAMMPFNRRKIDGYHRIYTMDKENSKSGWQIEHKLVAEKVLGRKLEKNEVVHHINFVRNDNRPENLQVMTDEEHQKLHRVNVERLNEQKWSIENKEWIEKFKSDHSTRMRLQNPAFSGITFEHIVNAAEKAQFSLQETLQLLEISNQQFHRLLAQNGFKNFQTLVNAYRNNDVRQTVAIKGVTELFVRDLDCIDQLDTKNSASVKLQCSVNVLDKFLMTRCHTSWIDFRRSKGWELTEFQHGGRPKKQFDSQNSEYQLICNTYTNGLSLSRLVQKTRLTTSRVMKYVHQAGFKNFKTWTESYRNHKVVSIEYAGVMDLYDLTVDGYKNFATDTVISHNTAEINSALDIYADETVAQDEKGRSLHIYSNNPKIKATLEDLYYNTLNAEFNMRPWIRNLCKYGDFFLLNDVSPEHGVINVIPIPINEIEREEGYDKADPQAVRFRWVTMGNRILENWEVTHMRLMGNDMFLPYGSSVLEGARRIWRQLVLIEDAMLVYRIVRSPERRVFYIDVGNATPEEIPILMEQARTTLRSQQIIDKTTGRVDLRYNPLSVDEDYFIPVRGTESGTRIDTLQGGQNTATVEDVEYIQRKLFAALKVPKAYLGYDEALSSKATLAQEDIRFSRTISMIQRTVISELNKIAIIHLTANGWEGEDLLNFSLRLSNPSTVAQQQKLELYRTKFEIAGTVPEGLLSREWIQRNIIGLSSEEILQIERQLLDDAASAAAREAAAAIGAGGGGGGGGGGGAPPPGDDGTAPPPPGDAAGGAPPPPGDAGGEPPPENAGASEEEDRELISDADDIDATGFRLSIKDDNAPIKAQNQLNKTLYNRGRRRTHGASKTHMPDFNKMVGNSKELNDPYDSESLRGFTSNPLGGPNESYDYSNELSYEVSRPVMSTDIDEMIKQMNFAFGRSGTVQPNSDGLLTESVEIQNLDEIDVFIEDEKKGDD